jgi:hypothetical protein
MTDDLDTLLKDDWLQPPPGFNQRVMHKLGAQILPPLQHKPPVHKPQTAGQSLGHRLRWLGASAAWAAGGLLGLSQLAAFVFGLWLTAAAL